MSLIDYSLIGFYLTGILLLGFVKRLRGGSSKADLILGGRMLTLPAFIASLVSTWYGGILGVGEYSFRYGLSNWLVFGLPYYLAAFLFAVFLARKARHSRLLTLPERLEQSYGPRAALIGSVIIFLMTVPAAYVLMLGTLAHSLLGWPFWVGVMVGTLFSIIYLFLGGFSSVVRTDILQFGFMFAGFIVLLVVLVFRFGGYEFLAQNLPEAHLTWNGGQSGWYIASWYVIALATLIEPAFFQRCYAAKNERTARNGILISILCWALFDFLSTSCGMYARALLPNLADPVASYPELAKLVLPSGLLGLFALSLLATVMSTVDSYSFLAATTFGRDIVGRIKRLTDRQTIFYTRVGLLLSTGLAVLFALIFRSAVDIWHAFGSIGTPALLVPVFFSFVGRRRLSSRDATITILSSATIATIWYLSKFWTADGEFFLSLQPIFPGTLLSLILYLTRAKG